MADETTGAEIARGALRASHEDRDRIVEALRVAAGDGRLSAEELDERLGKALTARTYGELAPLVADLPATAGGVLPGEAAPKDLVRLEAHSGVSRRDGRWVVPVRMEVKVSSGVVELDFTSAVITQPVLRITAEVKGGALRMITRPGIVVDAAEVAVHAGAVQVTAPWADSGPELLRVEVSGTLGSGVISAGPRYLRRGFWAWLTRKPRRYQLTP